MSNPHVFVGFGFGPIQSGLFAKEAFESGAFKRIVVAEIDQTLVDAVRAAGNRYALNIALDDRVEPLRVDGVELLNPRVPHDLARLREALCTATEVVTSLPSVDFYAAGGGTSVAALLAEALETGTSPGTLIYTAENNNHAAELLDAALRTRLTGQQIRPYQCLNTVIGKMSQVLTNEAQIHDRGLAPIAPGYPRAFLVESFNHILVSAAALHELEPGIRVFEEKADLLPFEEAKLFGHNAIHALLAYLAACRGHRLMSELRDDAELMAIGRRAFLEESGGALVRKYADLGDRLFTPDGFEAYATDLLQRMTSPFLEDAVERAARDPVRKLGAADRIIGTMSLAVEHGAPVDHMALGAAAGLRYLLAHADECRVPANMRCDTDQLDAPIATALLAWLWGDAPPTHADAIVPAVVSALPRLDSLARG